MIIPYLSIPFCQLPAQQLYFILQRANTLMSAGFTSSNLQNLSTHQNSAAYSPSFKCHSRANHAEGMLPPAYYIDVERVRLLGNILGLVTSWAELSLKTFPKSVDMKL